MRPAKIKSSGIDGLFENAFDFAAIGMALVAPNGRWLKVNRSLCQIVGYTESELLALTFQNITHPDDLELDLRHVRQMLKGVIESYQMEKRYVRKDGRIVWVLLSVSLVREDDGHPRFFISQIQNISPRKEAEQDRDALFQLAGVLQMVVGFDGKFCRVSPGFHAVLGWECEALIGSPLAELIHPEDRAACTDQLASLRRGAPARSLQMRLLAAGGSSRWLLLDAVAAPEREVIYAVGVGVTPVKEIEDYLRRTLREKEELFARLSSSSNDLRQLQEQLLTVCAWTKRIQHHGKWMSLDEFLSEHLHLQLTHGISDEAASALTEQGNL